MVFGKSRRVSSSTTRTNSHSNLSFLLSRGLRKKVLLFLFVTCLAWTYFTLQSFRPPQQKLCGSPGGPPITAPRVQLRDGRHLAYKEYGVPKDKAKYKFIFVHGFGCNRHTAFIATHVSHDTIQRLGLYVVGFDRPGYGESDPDPNRSIKSMALDVEDLADKLDFRSKFYVVGYSMGGEFVWGCLKYIPRRLAGVTLIAPVINYWWSGLPANLTTEAFYDQHPRDQWSLRVAHYAPWLTHWWQTQKWFPPSSVIQFVRNTPDVELNVIQQGEHESLHRDMMIGFGKWEFSPVEMEDPFPDMEGTFHIWHGDADTFVPVKLQRYIAKMLPWIRFHEIPGEGHFLPYAKGMCESFLKAQLTTEKN